MLGEKTYTPLTGLKLKHSEFEKVRAIIYKYCGINIQDGKEALVQSRLMKRIRALKLGSFEEYIKLIEQNPGSREFIAMVDVLTTNKTNFFREAKHFDFIVNRILPESSGKDLKWWNAGCSSGEEPITCAITLLENRAAYRWSSARILATDISTDILNKAKQGIYDPGKMADVPETITRKYFEPVGNGSHRVIPEVRNMITYGRLNLTDKWPMKGNFGLIMCRNVMIYFDRETREWLVDRFREMLADGGYLFLGHSEGLSKNNKGFRNVAPAVYQKR